jgi:ketosteroid isomerase-like protein
VNRISTLCLIVLIALGSASLSPLVSADDAVAKTILALEQKWLDAELANNAELSAPLFHDKVTFGGRDGAVTGKAEFLAAEKSTTYQSAAITEPKVSVYGDTAIVVYIFSAKGTASGKAVDVTERVTDTWVKMPSGEWQLVASHGSDIKK